MSFIQQLGAQCLSLSGKHLKNSLCFMPGYQAMVWPAHTTRATLNSGTLPTSFFSCLLFSLFTFQELSEVFPVCLHPASVLIFLFFSSFFLYFFFSPGQPQLNLVAAEQQSLLTCSIPGELIQSLSACGSLQRAPAQSCSKLAACSAFKYIMERTECQGRRAGRVGSRGLES